MAVLSRHQGTDSGSKGLYILSGFLALLFVTTRFLQPEFIDNEFGYSLNPMKFINHILLSSAPFIGKIDTTFIVYNATFSPLYYLLDPLWATIVSRIVIWIFQIWALRRFAGALGISWWGFLIVVVVWLNVEQTLVAGEWVIGCASSKPIAYGFIFLSLDSLLNERLKQSAVYTGLAVCFHILVGFWSALALFLTVVLSSSFDGRYRWKDILWFCILAGGVSLLGIVPAIYGMIRDSAQATNFSPSGVAEIYVKFANPFHVDPDYFLSPSEYYKLFVFFLFPFIVLRRYLESDKFKRMAIYLAGLIAFFAVGLIARRYEYYKYLMYYPFRVADGFFPLLFWISFILILQGWALASPWKKWAVCMLVPLLIGIANFAIDRFEPVPRYSFSLRSLSEAILHSEPRMTAYHARELGEQWYEFATQKQPDDMEALEAWIKKNTPEDSVLITPPWIYTFPLKTGREEFVSFKNMVVNKIIDWKTRLEILNGGKFQSVGFGILKELRNTYPKLKDADIHIIKNKYAVDYLITFSGIIYNYPLVYKNKSYYIYKLY